MNQPTLSFIAAGGNRHPAAADWDSSSGILAFASDYNIALWKPLEESFRGVFALLNGHDDAVNVVKFFRPTVSKCSLILSGSVDTTLRVWKPHCSGFSCCQIVKTDKSVNSIAVLPDAGLFASGSAAAGVNVWRIDDSLEVSLVQRLELSPKFFPLAIAFALLPSSAKPVLAVAGSKSIIQLFLLNHDHIEHAATLFGHEGWIRSLDFVHAGADLLLASASQDKYTRLWRIRQGEQLLPDALKDSTFAKSLANKAHCFTVGQVQYSATFEALLVGHEDWIYTARWYKQHNGLQLMTASADNSLAIWEADAASGVWICSVRLGSISAQKGATTATGSSGGFWTGLWSPAGDAVISLGRTGSWRIWKRGHDRYTWMEDVAVTGHTKPVQAVDWARDGSYLLSTGADQTTRLFAEWRKNGKTSWHEFSRPQIHGYNLSSIASISPSRFISGADEKLLRVFDKPGVVATSLERFAGLHAHQESSLPDAASVPVLGLSNQAMSDSTYDETALDKPPFEDRLARHLLWPEIEKLYGHGYEISAVCSSNDGTLVATACRASSVDHAVIRLYETTSWREVKPVLAAHSLTVTRLCFAPDDKYLLSVGRDRQCVVFERDQVQPNLWKKCAFDPKAHTRMILDASWAPICEFRLFATAGRDKHLHLWQLNNNDLKKLNTISAPFPITATDFLNRILKESLVLAYGADNGAISIVHLSVNDPGMILSSLQVDSELSPSRPINGLSWRPPNHNVLEACSHELATAGEDSSVRIYSLHSWINGSSHESPSRSRSVETLATT